MSTSVHALCDAAYAQAADGKRGPAFDHTLKYETFDSHAFKCNRREDIRPSTASWGALNAGSYPHLPFGLLGNPEDRYHQFGVHPGNPASNRFALGILGRMGGFGGNGRFSRIAHLLGLGAGCLALANCANGNMSSRVDPKYGVADSARLVAPGEPVPKGGVYRVGKPYMVGGHEYVPQEDVNYNAVGMASWYGDDFHGRYTANGEIFDMNSLSAAHPTLPLPSNVRVTNLANHRSIVVRVNDRGPYVGDRVIDVSAKTAKLLGFYGNGLTKVKVEYVGRAPLEGSDGRKLMATLR